MITLRELARALGGEITGGEVLAPGPGHSSEDRSLSVKPDRSAPDGFLAHSFADDDLLACRDQVRNRLGLGPFRPNGSVKSKRAKPVRTFTFEYRDPVSGEVRYQKTRREYANGSKDFYIEPKARGGSEPLLYGGERLADLGEGQPVWVVEGERKVDRLRELGAAGVSGDTGQSSAWLPSHAQLLRGRRIILWPDSDEPGEIYIRKAAAAFRDEDPQADIRVVRPFGLPNGAKGKDASDWVGDARAFAALIASAKPYTKAAADAGTSNGGEARAALEGEVKRLAEVPKLAYALERAPVAKRFKVPVGLLDTLVAAARPNSDHPAGQGRPLQLPEPEPWDDPVDGAELLDEIEAVFSRFAVCEPAARCALALWCCATWFEPVAQVAPILNITSPEMRCGKSLILSIAAKLSKRPLPSSNISAAALFRTIEKHSPALIIDEADSFLGENEELRGLINSGHTRDTAFVIKTVGEDHEPKQFSTWGFKAIAGIGKRAATIEDRSITISIKRKLPGEKVERLRYASPGLFETLARKLARFAEDTMQGVAASRPRLPEALNDRAQDSWELLIAIAGEAGGAWPQKAREAALTLSGVAEPDDSTQTQLLADIREAFAEKNRDRLTSADLIVALNEMPDRPWPEWNHSKGLTQHALARRLKAFGIRPKNVRIGGLVPKCYESSDFAETFARYLDPPFQSATTATSNKFNDVDENQTATRENVVAVRNEPNPLNSKDCSGVADQNPLPGEMDEDFLI